MAGNWHDLMLSIYNNYNFVCYKCRWNEKDRSRKVSNEKEGKKG